jgi:hypothetical protein
MTDRLTPLRLATIRNNHARDLHCGDEYRLQADNEDLGDLLGEVDRLATEREQLIAAILRLKQEPRIPLDAWYAYATVLDMARGTKLALRRDAAASQDEAQRGAEPLRDAPVMEFPPEPSPEPQRSSGGIDLSGELDALTPGQLGELKRISGYGDPYRCPTLCDDDCEALCHEGHEVGYKQRHDVAECEKRCAAEAWRYLLRPVKGIVVSEEAARAGVLDGSVEDVLALSRGIVGFDAPTDWAPVAARPRQDGRRATQSPEPAAGDSDAPESPQGPAEAVGIAPEDEGIATADVHAQIAADNARTGGRP